MTHDKYKKPGIDGRELCRLDALKFWFSRMPARSRPGRATHIHLTDLRALAAKVRSPVRQPTPDRNAVTPM